VVTSRATLTGGTAIAAARNAVAGCTPSIAKRMAAPFRRMLS